MIQSLAHWSRINGDKILCGRSEACNTGNPINDTGALGQEYKYLLNNNYRWDAATMTMKPRY